MKTKLLTIIQLFVICLFAVSCGNNGEKWIQGYWAHVWADKYLRVHGDNIYALDEINGLKNTDRFEDVDEFYKIGYHQYYNVKRNEGEFFSDYDKIREKIGVRSIDQMNKNDKIYAHVDYEVFKFIIRDIQYEIGADDSSQIKYLASGEDVLGIITFFFCERKQNKLIEVRYDKNQPIQTALELFDVYEKMSPEDVEKESQKEHDISIKRMKRNLPFPLNGTYSESEMLKLSQVFNWGGDQTITLAEFDSLPKELKEKLIQSGDAYQFPELRHL